MNYNFLIAILFLFCACSQKPDSEGQVIEQTSDASTTSNPIIGERINGPANIRDKPGGQIIFTLDDSVLVTCTEENNGWYNIGLEGELSDSVKSKGTLKKGDQIFIGGRPVGHVLIDTRLGVFEELTGYTFKDNIYPGSIIENSLAAYVRKTKGRSLKDYQHFIDMFQLTEYKELDSFTMFYTYENWIDDISPMPRIELVFYKDKLIGIVHTRHLDISGMANAKVENYGVKFFNDTPQKLRSQFLKEFNHFINSVD